MRTLSEMAVPVLLSVACGVARAEIALEITQPRPFGYGIGDVVEQQIRVNTNARLVDKSMPRIGRANAWVARRMAVIAKGDKTYLIRMRYQVVNVPAHLETVELPQADLVFDEDGHAITKTIPSWPVSIGPIVSLDPANPPILDDLRPDTPPAMIDIGPIERRIAASSTFLLGAALCLLGLRFHGRLQPGNRRPFGEARRTLKRMSHGPDRDTIRMAMRVLHQAFNATAGKLVLGENLDAFFSAHPRYVLERNEVERFFTASGRMFFAASSLPEVAMSSREILALCSRLDRIEDASD